MFTSQFVGNDVLFSGIFGWQYAFTPEGLAGPTKDWMNMFCKERLIVDKHWHENLSNK